MKYYMAPLIQQKTNNNGRQRNPTASKTSQ